MAQTGKKDAGDRPAVTPRSAELAAVGVRTGQDFAGLMSSLMSDVIEGRLSPSVANAACNAGGKLLKVVEMQYKYGSKEPNARPSQPLLVLAP